MKPLIAGIIGGVIGTIIVGSIFYAGILGVSNMEQNLERTNYKCIQIFDEFIIPILLGQSLPSERASEAWKEFELEKCATNHAQWEELSLNQDYIQAVGWDLFIQREQATLAQQEEEQKLEDIKSEIATKNFLTGYKINTECELVLLLVIDYEIAKFTFNEIQSEAFKAKYPDEINTIQKYNDLYQSITDETKDASDAYKEFPPEVLDATFEIMSKETSINPQLKSFVKSIFFGELSDEKAAQIAFDDKTQCGATLQKLL